MYTAYTPYQPEISQGRLEALLNFQTMCADLSGMDIANASLLDEATAAAEAMAMLHRVHKKPPSTFVVDVRCHPQTIEVVRVRAEPLGIDVVVADPATESLEGVYGILVQYPGTDGTVEPLEPLVRHAHEAGALVAVAADVLALVLLQSPGAAGADCVIARRTIRCSYGLRRAHAAFMATRDTFKRSLPAAWGVSIDSRGRTAYRLALQDA